MRYLTFIALLILIVSCRHNRNEESSIIAVSTGPQAWLVSRLMPDSLTEIVQLLPPGADPESFEPAIGTLKKLSKAELWFTMNTPGFEESLNDRISANFPNIRIADVSKGISRDVTHFCDHTEHPHDHTAGTKSYSHDDGDPHLLTSLRNAAVMAANMAEVLKQTYPRQATEINARSTELQAALRALDDSISRVFKEPGKSKAFLIEHPSLGYFARDYGLIQIPIQSGGKEPTPAQIAEAFATAVANNAQVMFVEREHPSRAGVELARQAGLKEIEISLYSSDYLNSIRKIVSGL